MLSGWGTPFSWAHSSKAEILHSSYFKSCTRGQNSANTKPKWQISAAYQWTFRAHSQNSLAFQNAEKTHLLAGRVAKARWPCTVTVLVNAGCLLNCLILKRVGKYWIVILMVSPEGKHMTQCILGQWLLLHWPWESKMERLIERPLAKHLLVRFLWSLSPLLSASWESTQIQKNKNKKKSSNPLRETQWFSSKYSLPICRPPSGANFTHLSKGQVCDPTSAITTMTSSSLPLYLPERRLPG